MANAVGDIPVRGASGQWTNLAAGTAGQVLRTGGTAAAPAWAYHQLTHIIHGNGATAATWTNMPAAATLLFGATLHVRKLDLSNYTQARMTMTKGSVAGVAGSKINLRYFTAWSATASDYLAIGTSEISLATDGGADGLVSSWVNLAVGAKADVWVAVIGTGGNGVVDPTFGTISAEFR